MAKKKGELYEDKAAGPSAENKGKADGGTVMVRVRPLRGIGGVGGPGTVVRMARELAEQYARDGYVDILNEEGE